MWSYYSNHQMNKLDLQFYHTIWLKWQKNPAKNLTPYQFTCIFCHLIFKTVHNKTVPPLYTTSCENQKIWNMDNNYNVIFGLCAIVTLLALFIVLFTYFLCKLENIGNNYQTDNSDNTQVLLHQCEDPLHNPCIYVTVSPPINIDPILESAI